MADSQPQVQVSKIVDEVKSQGLFDQLRRDCLSDVENETAYHRLKDQVDNFCKSFLARQKWHPNLDKTELRNRLREQLLRADFVDVRVKNLVERLVTESRVRKELYPPIELMVDSHLGLPRPSDSQHPKKPDTNDGIPKSGSSASGTAAARRSRSSDECKNDSVDEGASNKRPRLDKDSDGRASETRPPSRLPSEGDNTSTFATPVQDELNAPPVDPTPSCESDLAEVNVSDELSVHWHITELSPNPETGEYVAVDTEYVAESASEHILRAAIVPDEVESPAHERL